MRAGSTLRALMFIKGFACLSSNSVTLYTHVYILLTIAVVRCLYFDFLVFSICTRIYTMNKKVPERLLGRVSIEAEVGTAFSDTRIRLLEAVDQLGSISQAAKAVPLSYKAAWDAIDTMNNLASEPLVVRVTGGRQGGGTALTEYGRRVIALYRALEIETQTALERVGARLGEEEPIDVAGFRRLMHRMKMRSSARNQFSGPVVALRDGEVDFEVRLRIDDDTELAAVITRTKIGRAHV